MIPVVVLDFLSEWWILAALVLSEIAAFLPAKYKGIAHAVIKIVGEFCKQKCFKLKNL
jgi:hypothetical protein